MLVVRSPRKKKVSQCCLDGTLSDHCGFDLLLHMVSAGCNVCASVWTCTSSSPHERAYRLSQHREGCDQSLATFETFMTLCEPYNLSHVIVVVVHVRLKPRIPLRRWGPGAAQLPPAHAFFFEHEQPLHTRCAHFDEPSSTKRWDAHCRIFPYPRRKPYPCDRWWVRDASFVALLICFSLWGCFRLGPLASFVWWSHVRDKRCSESAHAWKNESPPPQSC